MKKVIFALALATAFASCGGSATAPAADTTKKDTVATAAVDTAAKKLDSAVAKVDSAAKKVDSAAAKK